VPKEDVDSVTELVKTMDEKIEADNDSHKIIDGENEVLVTDKELELKINDDSFLEAYTNGDLNIEIKDNQELSDLLEKKAKEYSEKQEMEANNIASELETILTTENETTTEEVQGVEQQELETTDTNGDTTTPESITEQEGDGENSRGVTKTTEAQQKYGIGKRGATGKVPLDNRGIKNPTIKKAADLDITPSSIRDYVRQQFATKGFQIIAEDIKPLINHSREELSQRLSMMRTKGKGGMTVDGVAHNIWESISYNEDIDIRDIKSVIEEIILTNPTRSSVAQGLLEAYQESEPTYTEKDGNFFNEEGEQVWETEYGWLSESDINELEFTEMVKEKYSNLDEDTYNDALDIFFSLTPEEISNIDTVEDSFIEAKLKEQTKETPISRKEELKQSIDTRLKNIRKGGLTVGGLNNLNDLAGIIKDLIELGVISLQDIIKEVKKQRADIDESLIEKAFNIAQTQRKNAQDFVDKIKENPKDVLKIADETVSELKSKGFNISRNQLLKDAKGLLAEKKTKTDA
ncbi:MAG: hypothetical protein KDD03_10110, partial [Gelidibacter sp.]|nr:hypothetical protein [Gelidibacter sp.]